MLYLIGQNRMKKKVLINLFIYLIVLLFLLVKFKGKWIEKIQREIISGDKYNKRRGYILKLLKSTPKNISRKKKNGSFR